MDSNKMDSDTKLLLKILPDLVWEKVLRYLNPNLEFGIFETYSEVSGFFDTVIQRFGYLSVVSRGDKIVTSSSYNEVLGYVPKTSGLCLFPQPILATPQITVMNICMIPNFRPINDYLKWFIISQRDSLKTLHISCLGHKMYTIKLKLPEMRKLQSLQIVRNTEVAAKNSTLLIRSLMFAHDSSLPALKSLTLSALGKIENWNDFLLRSKGSQETKYPSCHTVQRLCLLPSRPWHVWRTITRISENFVFPNLVSIEIPAVFLDEKIYKMFPAPESLKRLTLTLPTRGLHKHLFDACITGYGEQVCAALFVNPDRDPWKTREEIEGENELWMDDLEEYERYRIKHENELRRKGDRFPNLTDFTGLEELRIKSDTGDWGPTHVSCSDLLNMKSLKTLQFCEHEPQYISDDMMRKLRQRFTLLTPNSVKSCTEVFEKLTEKAELLSISRDKNEPRKFRNWLYSHHEFPASQAPRVLPQIKAFYISVNSNFHPLGYYLNCLLESQRDWLEIFHISCLEPKLDGLQINLPEMRKLRYLHIIRDIKEGELKMIPHQCLTFTQPPVIPKLETLTLSTIGWMERWEDFLSKPDGSKNPKYPTCETVKHLRLLSASPANVMCTYLGVHKYTFPNLVSFEIPAVHLDLFSTTFLRSPDTIKRITLTLPTCGLHKHLFDVCITGYGKQVCAALLACPIGFPEFIRMEIEDENLRRVEDIECEFEANRVRRDVRLRRRGKRFPGITDCSGLEELRIQSDTGDWGPTQVSCIDLLSMTSLRTLQFCGHRPKYIPDKVIQKMKQQFTVLWD